MEREAWDVYNAFYPNNRVVICFACPYHPRVLVADWVSNILPMYRMKEDINLEAGGSRTPHVNIHLGRMRSLSEFLLQEFEVTVDEFAHDAILEFIKSWDLNKPRRTGMSGVNWTQFNNVVKELQRTCPWLKQRWPENHPKAQKPPLIR